MYFRVGQMRALMGFVVLLGLLGCTREGAAPEKEAQDVHPAPTSANLEAICTMNGLGSGSCNFTNTEAIPGTMCGKIKVIRSDRQRDDYMTVVAESAAICSGLVAPKSTSKVEFVVPGISLFCHDALGWKFACSFEFVSLEEETVHATKLERARESRLIKDSRRRRSEMNISPGSMGQFCRKYDVQRKVSGRSAAIRACYELQLGRKPDLAGKVTMRWTIGLDGRVEGTKAEENSTGDERLDQCIASAISRIKFESPQGGICETSWSFAFSSGE